MSTILNALKKLEQEHKINKAGDHLQPPQTFPNRRAFGYESWRDRLSHFNIRWTWAAIALIGLVVGYIVAGPDPAPTQPTPVSSSDHVARSDRPELPSSPIARAQSGPADVPDRTVPVRTLPQPTPSRVKEPPPEPKPLETDIIEPKPLVASRKHVERGLAPNLPERSPREKAPLIPPPDSPGLAPEDQKTNPKPAPKTVDPQPNRLFSQAARLTDGRLEVQAIVWSPVVEDRMAVINNQVIHQGNTVEGFSVVEIGQDQVLVKEGGQYYVVFFGSR